MNSVKLTRGRLSDRAAVAAALVLMLLLGWLSAWGAASAQSFPPLRGVVSDSTGRIDAGRLNSAVRPLQDLGVKPLAVFAQSSSGADVAGFVRSAAKQYGLASNGTLDPNLLAIGVALDTRQATVVYGDGLKSAMEQPRSGGTLADSIRVNFLNPKLAGGDYTGAFESAFAEAARQISLYQNPPTATPVPTPAPAQVTNVDTSGLGSALLWGIALVIGVVVLAIVLPLIIAAIRRRNEAASRLRTLREQLGQARNTAADMITALDFPADPNEQIQYRFLRSALAEERPDELARITADYNSMYARVSDAITKFNTANSTEYNTADEVTTGIAQYQYVQQEMNNGASYLKYLADFNDQLEDQAAAAPGEVDSAKKALAAATGSLSRLAAAATDLYQPKADITFGAAQASLADAERSLASQPPRALHAYNAAVQARGQAEAVAAMAGALEQAYVNLAQYRAHVADTRRRGYKLAEADGVATQALDRLMRAAKGLEAGDREGFNTGVNAANESISASAASMEAGIALRARNEDDLAALRKAGEELRAYIEEGARTFDQVDEYAESSWADIRGNGTESQKEATAAQELHDEAAAMNALSPESSQDFEEAAQTIAQANQHIANARELITSIIQRLKFLQESQRIAQTEISAAAKDIAVGQAFIKQYDPDITPQPADLLAEAATLLGQARAEAAKPKPDWIAVVKQARRANDMADRALSDARSQQDAMQARRLKLQTVSQQAAASVSRAINFANVHETDVDNTVRSGVKSAQRALEQAQSLAAEETRGRLEDVALGKALDQAVAAFVASQQAADTAFSQAQTQFNAIESQRRATYSAIQDATEAIRQAAEYIQANQRALNDTPWGLVQRASDKLPKWRAGTDFATLQRQQRDASEAAETAHGAYNMAVEQVQHREAQERDRAAQDVINTAIAIGVLGQLLGGGGGGGRRRRDNGGWGGWGGWGGGSSGGSSGGGIFGGGGGSGGGIFGGGGSSSGGFGGGGHSSGGFGGGGHSSGGWGGGGSSSGGW